MKKFNLFIFLSLFSCLSQATRTTEIIHNDISIEPAKPFIVTVTTNGPIYVGWSTEKSGCTVTCIEARNISGEKPRGKVGAQHGATLEYQPVNGKVVIEYTNIWDRPIAIEVYTEERICDAEACQYLASKGIADLRDFNEVSHDWKRIISKSISSFETSKDGSYSTVKGESLFGTPYELSIIWWTIEEQRASFCKKWIPEKTGMDPETKKAYQFNGSYTTKPVTGIMTDISCSYTTVGERRKSDI